MKKAQAILGVTVIFIIGLLLFFGIIGMWMWGNNQIAKRQPEYNQTRVAAGALKESLGSAKGIFVLQKLIAQRDDLETQLVSTGGSIENSTAELETAKAFFEAKRDQYKDEKADLEAERGDLEAEQSDLEEELVELQRSCGGDDCEYRKQAIRARLGEIQDRIIEINDRINDFLIPEINRLQGIVDKINEAIGIFENDDAMPAASLEEQIRELNELIAELESAEESDPEAKDLYWPVYEPDELTEEDVFGLQK